MVRGNADFSQKSESSVDYMSDVEFFGQLGVLSQVLVEDNPAFKTLKLIRRYLLLQFLQYVWPQPLFGHIHRDDTTSQHRLLVFWGGNGHHQRVRKACAVCKLRQFQQRQHKTLCWEQLPRDASVWTHGALQGMNRNSHK